MLASGAFDVYLHLGWLIRPGLLDDKRVIAWNERLCLETVRSCLLVYVFPLSVMSLQLLEIGALFDNLHQNRFPGAISVSSEQLHPSENDYGRVA